MSGKLKELIVCPNDLEALIIKGVLEENAINAYIRKDDCGGMEPQLQITEGVKVMVPSLDYEQAKTLIERYRKFKQESAEDDGLNWKCSHCGEISEHQFSDCWNCGSPKIEGAD